MDTPETPSPIDHPEHERAVPRTTVREVCVKTALNKTGGFLRGYAFSLNPYSGCAFGREVPDAGSAGRGCPYCYVRELPFAKFRGAAWGSWVDAKVNLPERLAAELERLQRTGRLAGSRVFVGSATDPYQAVAETRYRLTRQCLDLFAERPPGGILLQTRSTLVRHDLTRLLRLRSRTNLVVSVTLETDRDSVRRRLTPTSPPVAARLRAMSDLRRAGLYVQAAVSPVLPCDPESFAGLLDPAVDRVVLDTFHLGDGRGGRRSDALGMGQLLDRFGEGSWYARDAHEAVLAAFRARLGPERVLLSADGFRHFPGDAPDHLI